MDISPLVAGINRRMPYMAPDGYFETLPVQVLLRIGIEEKAGDDPVLAINKEAVYEVPAGYFEGLAGSILNRIKAEQVATVQDELALLSPLLGGIEKKNPFSSPEDYFANVSENIVSGVKAIDFVNEELENLPAVLTALRGKPLYEVPDGYFETMPALIAEKVKQQQPAKVINIGLSKRIMRYAAAAIVTGIIALSAYLYEGKNTAAVTDIAKATAKIPDQEMENFLNNNTVSLTDTYADTVGTLTADAGDNPDDTKDLLADISDEELQKYVDQHSETPITN